MRKNKFTYLASLVLGLSIITSAAIADNGNNTINNTANGRFTNDLIPGVLAGSVAAEVGANQQRASVTLAVAASEQQRVKITTEYLRQYNQFGFYAGDVREWVNQAALGVGYQFVPTVPFIASYDVNAYYSHAPSKNLTTLLGVYASAPNTIYSDYRRIAGSNADGVSVGTTFNVWQGGSASIAANYDNVRYNTIYNPTSSNSAGLGTTLAFSQKILDNVKFKISSGIRKPANEYEAGLFWDQTKALEWGLSGQYVQGKNGLNNTSAISLQANYILGPVAGSSKYINASGDVIHPSFTVWAGKPAVYMPSVYAIADERLVLTQLPVFATTCVKPELSSLSSITMASAPSSVNLQNAYLSQLPFQPLTFNGSGLPTGVSLDSSGNLAAQAPAAGTYTGISITVTNNCGLSNTNNHVTLSVGNVCTNPNVSNVPSSQTIIPTGTINVATYFSGQPNAGSFTYNFNSSPSGGNFTISANGVVAANNTTAGLYTLYITVVDPICGTHADFKLSVTVAASSCDNPNIVVPQGGFTLHIGQPYQLNTITNYPPVTYSALSPLPSGITLSAAGVLLADNSATIGSNTAVIGVENNCGNTDSVQAPINVMQ